MKKKALNSLKDASEFLREHFGMKSSKEKFLENVSHGLCSDGFAVSFTTNKLSDSIKNNTGMIDIKKVPIPRKIECDKDFLLTTICDMRFKIKNMMLELGAIYDEQSASKIIDCCISNYPDTKIDITLLCFKHTHLDEEKGQLCAQLFNLCSDLDKICIDLDEDKNIYDIAYRLLRAGMTYQRVHDIAFNPSSRDGVRQHYVDRYKAGPASKGKGKIQQNPAIKEFMINDLVNRMIAGNGNLPFDSHRRAKEATLNNFKGIVKKRTLEKYPFRLKDLESEIKNRYNKMK